VDHRRAGHEELAAAKLELVRGLLPSDAVNLVDLLHRRLAVVQLRKYRRLIGDTENIPYEEMLAKEAGTLAQALPANIGRLYWPIEENEGTSP
jgi:hypothetical protein